jgi:CheY-like chemotaxis protein
MDRASYSRPPSRPQAPGVGGHEVLAAVRAAPDERVRRIPIVVLTHSEVLDDVVRSYDLGANSHIAKPN